jgi:hypothetical protein
LSFVLGAFTVSGFAPFALFPVPVLTLAALLLLWQRAGDHGKVAILGFAYGLGFFLCGVSWIYVSLHDFGAMPAPLAALATLLFCAFLALFPALAGYLYAKVPFSASVKLGIFFPAAWTLLEWTRGWLFTGFPWLAFGYSQIPSGPLSGYAPVFGVYGVSLVTVVSAGLVVVLWARITSKDEGGRMKDEEVRMKGKGTEEPDSTDDPLCSRIQAVMLERRFLQCKPSSLSIGKKTVRGLAISKITPTIGPRARPWTISEIICGICITT